MSDHPTLSDSEADRIAGQVAWERPIGMHCDEHDRRIVRQVAALLAPGGGANPVPGLVRLGDCIRCGEFRGHGHECRPSPAPVPVPSGELEFVYRAWGSLGAVLADIGSALGLPEGMDYDEIVPEIRRLRAELAQSPSVPDVDPRGEAAKYRAALEEDLRAFQGFRHSAEINEFATMQKYSDDHIARLRALLGVSDPDGGRDGD